MSGTEKTNLLFKKLMSSISTRDDLKFYQETKFSNNKNIFSNNILANTPSNTPTYSTITDIEQIQTYLRNDDPNIIITDDWYTSKIDSNLSASIQISDDGLSLRFVKLKLDYITDSAAFACMDASTDISRNILKNIIPANFDPPGNFNFSQGIHYKNASSDITEIIQLSQRSSSSGINFGAPLIDPENGIVTFYDIQNDSNPASNFSGYSFYITVTKYVGTKGVFNDGTLKDRRGSLTIDDEGTPTQNTILIENGILKNFMQDRLNARLMKISPTGNGRRQSYSSIPMPRMTNTYMLNGQYDHQELIESTKNGIYATQFSGGQVDITSGKFVFSASEAYLVKDGKIERPIKGATLIGNGPDVLKRVSMVANNLEIDKGIGTCGKEGQSVPVGVGQPSLKVDNLTVGGTT